MIKTRFWLLCYIFTFHIIFQKEKYPKKLEQNIKTTRMPKTYQHTNIIKWSSLNKFYCIINIVLHFISLNIYILMCNHCVW